jgi:hypothetical protein
MSDITSFCFSVECVCLMGEKRKGKSFMENDGKNEKLGK